MALCNLATVEELRDRIVREKGWRVLEMALTSDNELVQRACVECMSNLVTNDEVAGGATRAHAGHRSECTPCKDFSEKSGKRR